MSDVAVFNRLTGATMATHLALVKPGDVVIGVSATHSHPSVVRAAGHVGARFIDTAGLGAFREAIASEHSVDLVVLTRLAVTYDLLPLEAIETIVRLAHDQGSLVYVDDAGGARVGPAGLVSRGRWSSASISARPVSTNMARRGHDSACSPVGRS
jgi:L-seryl-tRNA(Ser) seleniumtransferase